MMTVTIMKKENLKTRVGMFKTMSGNISGENFPRGRLMGWNFPGGSFPDTINAIMTLLRARNN